MKCRYFSKKVLKSPVPGGDTPENFRPENRDPPARHQLFETTEFGKDQNTKRQKYKQTVVVVKYLIKSATIRYCGTGTEMEKAYKIAQMKILAKKVEQKCTFRDIFQFAPKLRKFP